MAEYLFLFTIGPVQEFIAAARRTRDLWFGSWLLSDLSRAAAQAIPDWQDRLIFPSPVVIKEATNLQNETASVANKIVAVVETDDIASISSHVKAAVIIRLNDLRDAAFRNVPDWSIGDIDLAKQQVAELLQCYWAAVPFPGRENYPQQRALLEQVMAARKATRQFTQVELHPAQERYPKSSLDGQRESVIRESAYPDRDDDEDERHRKLQKLFDTFGAKQAERLSGVDLLKRRGNPQADEADFPSTSHFAAIPFLERLASKHGAPKIHTAFISYRDSLEALVTNDRMLRLQRLEERFRAPFDVIDNYDASILYMSRLTEEIDARDEDTRKSAEQALQQFLRAAAKDAQPKAYYALLQADGDSMGKVIDNQETVDAHKALSGQLAAFAKEARGIVERNKGALVYAGGDDVLALLPIDGVLPCARDLHSRFDTLVGSDYCCDSYGKPHFVDATGKSPTLSIGIAICHHLEPLNDALALVRQTEQAAKRVPGKNGLAIAVEKRSGEPQRISGSWMGTDSLFTRLHYWLKLMQDVELSAGAPYELRTLAERLGEPHELTDADRLRHQAIAEEAGRIIERKRGQHGNRKPSEADIAYLRAWLGLPEKANGELVIPAGKDRYRTQKLTVRQLADELIVARELVRLGAEPVSHQQGEQP